MSATIHIAVVDDEVDITQLLASYLTSHGFRVTRLSTGHALLDLMVSDPPALVLLDLGLPGEDGLQIAAQLRERARCGLVILTGRGDAVDKIVGLELGADDYITKPFELRELLARVKAVLRRVTMAPQSELATPDSSLSQPTLVFEPWKLDLSARRLTHSDGHEVVLTTGEFDLLSTFARHRGRVLTRDFLLEQTRGRDSGPYERTIDVQVGRLRKKLEVDPENPQIFKSVRGVGYIFIPAVTVVQRA